MSGQVTGQRDPWHLYGYLDNNGRYYVGLSAQYDNEIGLTVEQCLELANLLVEEAKTGLREQVQFRGDWEAEGFTPWKGSDLVYGP